MDGWVGRWMNEWIDGWMDGTWNGYFSCLRESFSDIIAAVTKEVIDYRGGAAVPCNISETWLTVYKDAQPTSHQSMHLCTNITGIFLTSKVYNNTSSRMGVKRPFKWRFTIPLTPKLNEKKNWHERSSKVCTQFTNKQPNRQREIFDKESNVYAKRGLKKLGLERYKTESVAFTIPVQCFTDSTKLSSQPVNTIISIKERWTSRINFFFTNFLRPYAPLSLNIYKMNYLACLILLSDGTKLRSKKKFFFGITPLGILKNFQIRISPINRK